ncbi:LOW QUALITY PROTEIN: MT12B-like protein [Mya arenaria]|uniref:MT12B-like protein n=1 Tax=Mya arenaria TaxID=6604 RepID=A0ABY7EED2_MYAAR|nr:LOW QUALITY PROTEIN: MT12B-like protein [Mya arenaria]
MTDNTGQQQTGLHTLSARVLCQLEDIPFGDLIQQHRMTDMATHGTVEAPGDGLDQQCNMNDQLSVRATDTPGEASENGLDQQQRKDTVPKGTTDISGEAPDGGWGWVITCAALLSCFIVDGISFSFGFSTFRCLITSARESDRLDLLSDERNIPLYSCHTTLNRNNYSVEEVRVTLYSCHTTLNRNNYSVEEVRVTLYSCHTTLNRNNYSVEEVRGPIASMSENMFGRRVTAIAGSTIASIAFFLCTFSPNDQMMIVVYGFLGAVGIASCGTGIGTFAVAPLSEYLISNYGWKGAMWIIAGIALNGIPIGALLRPLERRRPRVKAGFESDCKRKSKCNKCNKTLYLKVKSVFEFDLLKSPTMLLLCAGSFICVLGFFIPFTYLPDHAMDLSFSPQQGTMFIAIIGISNTVFRVLAGWVADRIWSNQNLIKAVILFIGGAVTVGVPWYPTFGIMAGYSTIYGICIAVYVTYHTILIASFLGVEKLTSAFGLSLTAQYPTNQVITKGRSCLLEAPSSLPAFLHSHFKLSTHGSKRKIQKFKTA